MTLVLPMVALLLSGCELGVLDGFLLAGALPPYGSKKDTFAIPSVLTMGQMVENARTRIDRACRSTRELKYTGAMAAPASEQIQINCDGLKVFGAARSVEFMFNDGVLEFAWVLTQKGEDEALSAGLVERFGPVVYSNDDYRVFSSGDVALRAEPPEVLLATPELIRDITGIRGS